MTRLLLTRHGQTEWHAENRYAGTSEVALTEAGVAQAQRLATHLAGWPQARRPTALYSSPLGRARSTAAPVAETLGLPMRVHERLTEVYFGRAEGRTLAEVEREEPEVAARFRADPVRGSFPGADDPAAAALRGAAALREIAAAHPEQVVLVVAHNTLLRLTLCQLLGIPLHTYRRVFPGLGNAALTELAMNHTGDATETALIRFNQDTQGDT